jgi:hypothetical protein
MPDKKEAVTLTKPEVTETEVQEAPKETPAEAPVETSALDEPEVSPEEWSDLANDDEPIAPPAEPLEATAESEPEPETETIPQEVDTPVKAEVEEEPEPPVEPEPEPEQQPTEPVAEQQPQYTDTQINEMWHQREAALLDAYQMSAEEGEALLTNAEEVVPRLAAKIQVATEKAVWTHLNTVLPQMIGQVQATQAQAAARDDAFYNNFPALRERVSRDVGARNVVENMRNLFQQHNPQMAQDELDAQVGAAAMVALKVPFTDEPATSTGPRTPRKVPPHRPATPRQAGPATHKPQLGAIEAYAEQLLQDEDGSSVVF